MNVNAKRDNSRIKEIEIMDCTLRDGEQTNGVSFLPHEKLMIARMLLHDINVDRIEVASANEQYIIDPIHTYPLLEN